MAVATVTERPCAALVVLDLAECPSCSSGLREQVEATAALFRHGGYGATYRVVRLVCEACGWQIVPEESEVRP